MFSALGLVELALDERTGEIASTTNLTILNVFLLRLGPMREDSLTRVLIATQVSAGGLFLLLSFGHPHLSSDAIYRPGCCGSPTDPPQLALRAMRGPGGGGALTAGERSVAIR